MLNKILINPIFKDRSTLLNDREVVLSQLKDIISFSNQCGFDWYFTRIPDLRCGIRALDAQRAELALFRIWFRSKGFLRIDLSNKYFYLPMSDKDLSFLKNYIKKSQKEYNIPEKKSGHFPIDYDDREVENYSFDRAVAEAAKMTSEERLQKLSIQSKIPEKVTREVKVYLRNPNVVAESLHQANGSCQSCGKKAPFIRRFNKQPYLEVHHIKPLSQGGNDSLDNVKALCPNCHRKIHYG
ncbi:HNH endonuclease [Gluconobacter albidus]|uniref:HNH endonuclease n=1 Tax=Gluconobacter albidus TaxID=318683 RepID=UPI001B8D894F|nr:HNH endonuclease [Gluconobacter albidus]MBS1029161.1 HNH endonuclease [Gluconobacter albidus]